MTNTHSGPIPGTDYGSIMAHVKMYTRRWCGYCTAAQRLLDEKGVDYEEIDTTGDQATRRWLVQETGRTTVPQIFIDGVSVGGYDDIRALDRQGKLDPMLAAPPKAKAASS